MQDIHHHDGDFPACEHGHLPDVEVDDQGQTMHKVYCSKGMGIMHSHQSRLEVLYKHVLELSNNVFFSRWYC